MNRPRLLFAFLFMMFATSVQAETLRVYAPSSLEPIFTEDLGALFEKTSGIHLQTVFGTSASLVQQIKAGAPADILITDQIKLIDTLATKVGFQITDPVFFGANRLVLISSEPSAFQSVNLRTFDWRAALKAMDHLAMADPIHVPAGIYTKQGLMNVGAWSLLKDHVVFLSDAPAVVMMVERGLVPLGIAYQSDANRSKSILQLATFPLSSHDQIRYAVVALGQNSQAKTQFVDFMGTAAVEETLIRYGFQSIVMNGGK